MEPTTTVEMVDDTWPALQRAERIFGSRADATDTFRGIANASSAKKADSSIKPKRSLS